MTIKHNLAGGAQTDQNGLSDLSETIINSGKYTIDDNAFVIENSTHEKKESLRARTIYTSI